MASDQLAQNLEAKLAACLELHPKRIDLSLERIERLLARLGHPQRHLPPVVHVAGTNGKGSTLAFLAALLTQCGLRWHRYTSPHLVHFRERIYVAGEEISDRDLLTHLEACIHANAAEPITFFEITTAAALRAFSQADADFVLLETGLGGRVDATHVFPDAALAATVLTPIGYDHMEFLGTTLAQIAKEKAAIIKTNTPLLSAQQDPVVLNEIAAQRRACQHRALYALAGRDWQVGDAEPHAQQWTLSLRDHSKRTLCKPALAGPFQRDNAALAIMTAQHICQQSLSDQQINQALRSVHWPGRLQSLHIPAKAQVPITIDGAHNQHAMQSVVAYIQTRAHKPRVILGQLKTKNTRAFLKLLLPQISELQCVPVPDTSASMDAEALSQLAHELCIDVPLALPAHDIRSAGHWQHALRAYLAQETTREVMILGSLYLIGDVLKQWQKFCHSICADA